MLRSASKYIFSSSPKNPVLKSTFVAMSSSISEIPKRNYSNDKDKPKKNSVNYKNHLRNLLLVSAVTIGGISYHLFGRDYSYNSHDNYISHEDGLIHPRHPSRLFSDLGMSNTDVTSTINRILSENERVYGSDYSRIHLNSIASNEPIEDRVSLKTYKTSQGDKLDFYGVYDGHSGFQCSEVVKDLLPYYIARKLSSIRLEDHELIRENIKQAFDELDKHLIEVALEFGNLHSNDKLVMPALAGSVVLQAVLINGKHLFVGGTGDVRAVYGSLNSDGSYQVIPLSNDHNAHNPEERARIYSEHPESERPSLLANSRVLGSLQPTRSFGDGVYKIPLKSLNTLASNLTKASSYVVNHVRVLRNYETPPYVIASPEVSYQEVRDGDFLVIASDGLWDDLNNDEAIAVVSDYLSKRDGIIDENSSTSLIRTASLKIQSELDRTTSVKNSLYELKEGGLNLYAIPAPYSRRVRDDITVLVSLFGPADSSVARLTYKDVQDLGDWKSLSIFNNLKSKL